VEAGSYAYEYAVAYGIPYEIVGSSPTSNCLVNFDPQGGSYVPAVTVSRGSSIGSLPATSREGYTFDGWYTAASGGAKIAEDAIVTGNVTYYAHWTVIKASSPTSTVDNAMHKAVAKITAKAKCTVKKNKTIKITLTKYKNVTVKSVSISAKHKKLVKVTKAKNAIKVKGLKKGKAKITVTITNGNKKTFTVTVK
jgi:uncharacterized repeat protein (TIGR02543 family)